MKLRTRLAYQILSPPTWSDVLNELALRKSTLLARLGQRRIPVQPHLKLHLGCGTRIAAGWINVDAFKHPGVDFIWDVRNPLPLPPSSVNMIYSEHLLEHLEKPAADALLVECYRVLERGGLLRIGVPDAALYLRAYTEGRTDLFKAAERLGNAVEPLSTPMAVINQVFRMGGAHRYAWDYDTLSLSLRRAGFTHLTRYAPGKASTPAICLDDPAHAFETLYVEARP